jgi:integrase
MSRNIALFNLAIDSKLRSYDLVKLRVSDIAHGNHILNCAMVMQQKTQRPVQFKIAQKTSSALTHWIEQANLSGSDYLFKGQTNSKGHISTRQYARIIKS